MSASSTFSRLSLLLAFALIFNVLSSFSQTVITCNQDLTASLAAAGGPAAAAPVFHRAWRVAVGSEKRRRCARHYAVARRDGADAVGRLPGAEAFYYEAFPGDTLRLRFYFKNQASWRVEIRRPDGSLDTLLNFEGIGFLLLDNYPLPVAGNWFFYVYDEDGVGAGFGHGFNLAFQIFNKAACFEDMLCKKTGEKYLSLQAETHAFRLVSVAEGDRLLMRFRFLEPNSNWQVEIRKPDGSLHSILSKPGGGLLAPPEMVLTAGTWFFLIYDSLAAVTGGVNRYQYNFQILKTACATPLNCGTNLPTVNLATAVETDAYYVNVTSCGLLKIVCFASNPDLHESLWLYAPDGSLAGTFFVNNDQQNVNWQVPILPGNEGVYLLLFGETESDNQGIYSISATCSSLAPTANPGTLSHDATGGQATFSIAGACLYWQVSEDVNWLSVSPSGGTGTATVTVNFAENETPNPRSTFLKLTGCCDTTTVQVTQAGATLALSLAQISVAASGGNQSLGVASTCSEWSFLTDADWISPEQGGGSGNRDGIAAATAARHPVAGRKRLARHRQCGALAMVFRRSAHPRRNRRKLDGDGNGDLFGRRFQFGWLPERGFGGHFCGGGCGERGCFADT